MEATKFHNLLSASWRIGKAGSIMHPESKGLKTTGAYGVGPSYMTEDKTTGKTIGESPRV